MAQLWRVLVADDDKEICALIQTILSRGPYALTVCHDAESALARLGLDEPFDMIICDFMLPGMSGLELIAQIRADEAWVDVPIVMISGHSTEVMDAHARGAGANVFLNKPFTVRQLQTTVRTLLDTRLARELSRFDGVPDETDVAVI